MVNITSIKIQIGEREITMTLEEAKDFQKLLNETFPDCKSGPTIINPIIIERTVHDPWQPFPGWEVTCGVSSGTLQWRAR
jgi:hypothetical protein